MRPGEDEKWFEYWREQRMAWQAALVRDPSKLRWHQHGPNELAHYAKAAYDIEFEFPFGWQEFEGIHNRTDFDLSRHQQASGKKLEYFDQERNERYLPYIIETSLGADRLALVVLRGHLGFVANQQLLLSRFGNHSRAGRQLSIEFRPDVSGLRERHYAGQTV